MNILFQRNRHVHIYNLQMCFLRMDYCMTHLTQIYMEKLIFLKLCTDCRYLRITKRQPPPPSVREHTCLFKPTHHPVQEVPTRCLSLPERFQKFEFPASSSKLSIFSSLIPLWQQVGDLQEPRSVFRGSPQHTSGVVTTYFRGCSQRVPEASATNFPDGFPEIDASVFRCVCDQYSGFHQRICCFESLGKG